jgi:hypothetical protein
LFKCQRVGKIVLRAKEVATDAGGSRRTCFPGKGKQHLSPDAAKACKVREAWLVASAGHVTGDLERRVSEA